MIRIFLISGLRNLISNALPSFINIFGLSVAIACCLVVYSFINLEYNANSFHSNKDNIFLITSRSIQNEQVVWSGGAPSPLGFYLQEFNNVNALSTVDLRTGVIEANKLKAYETLYFVDDTFLNMFDFPLVVGPKNVLSDPNSIVLVQKAAIKYFGRTDVVGETIDIKVDHDYHTFKVGAILYDLPNLSTLRFDFLISRSNLEKLSSYEPTDWSDYSSAIFVQLTPDADIPAFEAELTALAKSHITDDQKYTLTDFRLFSVNEMFHYSYLFTGSIVGGNDPNAKIVLSILAIIILSLSIINYINISLTNANYRLKEIGIRKISGSSRTSLVGHFIFENAILVFFSLFLGLIICLAFLKPGLSYLLSFDVPMELSSIQLWLFMFALLVSISIASGAYPALYVASFSPLVILRNRIKFKSNNTALKVFQFVQLGLAFFAVSFSIAFIYNGSYLNKKLWGYNHADFGVIRLVQPADFEIVRSEALKNNYVDDVVGTHTHIGVNKRQASLTYTGFTIQAVHFEVGESYLSTLNVPLVEGRSFEFSNVGDLSTSIILSESAVKGLSLADPLGAILKLKDGTERTVIGIVSDVRYDNFMSKALPLFYTLAPVTDYNYAAIKFSKISAGLKLDVLNAISRKLDSDEPITTFLQSDLFQNSFKELTLHKSLILFIGTLSLILASMGVYAMLRADIKQNQKKYSIRLIHGATFTDILFKATRKVLVLIGLSAICCLPLAIHAIRSVLNQFYTNHVSIQFYQFIFPLILILIVFFITVFSELIKLVKANHIGILREDY